MEKRQYCRECKQVVAPKHKLSWLFIIISLLLFWPITLIYLLVKYIAPEYVCPMCGMGHLEEIE